MMSRMILRRLRLLLPLGLAILGAVQAHGYLDGRPVLELLNASQYEEAFRQIQSSPERYAQWGAIVIRHAVPPIAHNYSLSEADVRGTEFACKYADVNKESAAYCYSSLMGLYRSRDYVPPLAQAMTKASLPSLTPDDAQTRLEALAKEGVPYAVYRLAPRDGNKDRLRELADRYPYSLGGVLAAAYLSLILWEEENYAAAVPLALRGAGVTGTAGGVLAYAEYYGIGVKKDPASACTRALFWAKRTLAGPAVYTLGLCYMEGAGGLPKDQELAYGIFWTGRDYSRYPRFADRIRELEKVLTPGQIVEGRRRGAKFLIP